MFIDNIVYTKENRIKEIYQYCIAVVYLESQSPKTLKFLWDYLFFIL